MSQFNFDKFMDDILVKEAELLRKKQQLEEQSDTPQREYVRRYRELPQNRMKVER